MLLLSFSIERISQSRTETTTSDFFSFFFEFSGIISHSYLLRIFQTRKSEGTYRERVRGRVSLCIMYLQPPHDVQCLFVLELVTWLDFHYLFPFALFPFRILPKFYAFVCLFFCLSVCLSVSLSSLPVFVCLFVYLFIWLSVAYRVALII